MVFADSCFSLLPPEESGARISKPHDAGALLVGACLQATGGTDSHGSGGRAQARSYLNSVFQYVSTWFTKLAGSGT